MNKLLDILLWGSMEVEPKDQCDDKTAEERAQDFRQIVTQGMTVIQPRADDIVMTLMQIAISVAVVYRNDHFTLVEHKDRLKSLVDMYFDSCVGEKVIQEAHLRVGETAAKLRQNATRQHKT